MKNVYLVVTLSLLCYLLYFLAIRDVWKKDSNKYHSPGRPCMSIALQLHIIGIMLFGLPFTIQMQERMKFLSYPNNPAHFLMPLMVLLIVSVFILSWFVAAQKNKLPGMFNYSPDFSYGTTAIYLLLRVVFLIAYEFFFRGVLLFGIAMVAGIITSIIINIILYVVIHLFSERQAMIGAVPFGIVLCMLSWKTQSIWPAVILHLVLALTYEIKMINHLFHSSKKLIV